MTDKRKCDFSGYATKASLKCTDGRVIEHGAFKGSHAKTVPLVWQHFHDNPNNVLGNVYLEHRDDGIYAYGMFNDTEAGKNAKLLVQHKDVDSLSIFANQLIQNGSLVKDGVIREVSLVLAAANPGARIDFVSLQHADGTSIESEDEAIIYTGLPFTEEEEPVQHDAATATEDKTVQEVFDGMSDEEKTVVYIMISKAIDQVAADNQSMSQSDQEGDQTSMKHNVFEPKTETNETFHLDKDQFKTLIHDAIKDGSFKKAFLAHAGDYGIDNIDVFFPDAKLVTPSPSMVSRNMAWVDSFLNGAKHVPFSRIKSTYADITADAARAKGYVKGDLKIEEVIAAFQRITVPTTVYKKQKLDHDDIIDITDFDVVTWLWAEMRLLLNEEVARAGLIGDGRALTGDPEKIKEDNIRPIYKDSDVYVVRVRLASTDDTEDLIEQIIRARKDYRGSGSLVMYTTSETLTDMLLLKDTTHRDIYDSKAKLMSKLMVSDIVEVDVMQDVTRVDTDPTPDVTLGLVAILVNPNDYTYGANKGGELGRFDQFDIDYNQHKYLLETRLCGALTIPSSAIVVEKEEPAG